MHWLLLAANGDTDVMTDAEKAWNAITEFVMQRGLILLQNIIAAIVIFYVGKWISRFLVRLIKAALIRAKIDETLSSFLSNIANVALMTFVIMAALNRLGLDTTSFAAAVAAAGLAVGLALQGSLSNFAAGVIIILFKPFQVGNYVEAGGTAGVVEAIHIFNTKMRTPDNVEITVPNGAIITGTIKNYSAKETRRIDLVVGCGYDDDLRTVKQFLEDLVRGDERILTDPEPVVAVNELGASSVDFVVRPWVNASDYWDVRFDLNEKIKLGFDENGFTIPYPQRDVHLHGMTAPA
jgi:small conductance mechanosensitive channel